MIKVEKDLSDIPPSLNSKPETLTGHARKKARTTYTRRLEHIRAKNISMMIIIIVDIKLKISERV